MSERAILSLSAILAMLGWLGMCSFTYYNPPAQQNLRTFLVLLGSSLWAGLLPVAYRLHRRPPEGESILPRVARRSALVALFAVICIGLRFIRALSWANAFLLLTLFVLTEVVISTR